MSEICPIPARTDTELEPSDTLRALLHQANNDLSTILTNAEAGLLHGKAPEMKQSLETVRDAALRVAKNIRSLRREILRTLAADISP